MKQDLISSIWFHDTYDNTINIHSMQKLNLLSFLLFSPQNIPQQWVWSLSFYFSRYFWQFVVEDVIIIFFRSGELLQIFFEVLKSFFHINIEFADTSWVDVLWIL